MRTYSVRRRINVLGMKVLHSYSQRMDLQVCRIELNQYPKFLLKKRKNELFHLVGILTVDSAISLLFTKRVRGLGMKSVLSKQHGQSWITSKLLRKIFPQKERNSSKGRIG